MFQSIHARREMHESKERDRSTSSLMSKFFISPNAVIGMIIPSPNMDSWRLGVRGGRRCLRVRLRCTKASQLVSVMRERVTIQRHKQRGDCLPSLPCFGLDGKDGDAAIWPGIPIAGRDRRPR